MSQPFSISLGQYDRSEIRGGDLLSEQESRSASTGSVINGYSTVPSQPYLGSQTKYPIDGIASFCRLAAGVGVHFQPRTIERPWALSAGEGGTAMVECHRFVPGRQFDSFNRHSEARNARPLVAHRSDPNRTGQYYAVKRLTNFQTGSNVAASALATQYDQLATELRVLAYQPLRKHPNIIEILGVAHFLGTPMLVLEDGNCGSLDQFMKLEEIIQRKLFELKMNFCIDIACGLEALHRHGVVHADIKASNVLVTCHFLGYPRINRTATSETACRNFSAKICDFGFSMILSDDPAATLLPKGRSRYWSAPEVTSQEAIPRDMFQQIDVYSAGMVFASIFLDGEHPYSAFIRSENANGRAINEAILESRLNDSTYTPFGVTMQALRQVDFSMELRETPNSLTRYTFPQQYCEWELKTIEPMLKYTLSKEPIMRLFGGERVHRAVKGLWTKAKPDWLNHRPDCTGSLATYERNMQRKGPEITPQGFSPRRSTEIRCSSW
jgi:serine/threonine protein kinase